jgi:hypothetical protein
MWDHHRLTRGIIQILVTRLRSMMTAHPTGDAAGIADQGRGT